MKTYKESTADYKCTGCGATIYNATKHYEKCPECGYKLVKVVTKGCEHCGRADCHWLLHG